MKQNKALWILVAQGVLVGACAPAYDERHPFNRGWRSGEVLRIERAEALGGASTDCRRSAAPTQGTTDRFAYIRLEGQQTARKHPRSGLAQRHAIMPIPSGMALTPGDDVLVNIRDCLSPMERQGAALR